MRTQHNRTRREAFTLLEVMLVVGILAMLAVLVVPRFIGTQQRAELRIAEGMVGPSGVISGAINSFRMEHGQYPEALIDLIEFPDYLEMEEEDWPGPYLDRSQEFKDPWGSELIYRGGEEAQVHEDEFDLISLGPDKKEGTRDDISNFRQED